MKNQTLFSSKDESKILKCRLLQFLFGALRVKKNIAKATHQYSINADPYKPLFHRLISSYYNFEHKFIDLHHIWDLSL